MAGKNHYKAEQFIEKIPGTKGIISTIAKRMGCDWNTAKKYIESYPTIKTAWEAEKETILDNAESVVFTNISIAEEQQRQLGEVVDSKDAKWVLSRLGKSRGYTTEQGVSLKLENELNKVLDHLEKSLDDSTYQRVIAAISEAG